MAESAEESAAESFVKGALRAGIDTCVYLPDSVITPIIRGFQRNSNITMISCTREDEGIGIAVGMELGGRSPVCLMEASGLGLSGLILARAQVQRTPVFVVASHTRGGGEPYDYHGATTLVSEGMFAGLGIPFEIARGDTPLESLVYRIVQTVRGQRTSFGLLIPPYLMSGDEA